MNEKLGKTTAYGKNTELDDSKLLIINQRYEPIGKRDVKRSQF